MRVNPATAKGGSFEHAGTTYYFCNPRCRERFAADPAHYSKPKEPEPVPIAPPPALRGPHAQSAPERFYICPMDPEVRKREPGACPKCGMALELEPAFELSDASERENPELASMSRRLWASALFTAPVVGLAMFGMPLAERWGHERLAWFELVLSAP